MRLRANLIPSSLSYACCWPDPTWLQISTRAAASRQTDQSPLRSSTHLPAHLEDGQDSYTNLPTPTKAPLFLFGLYTATGTAPLAPIEPQRCVIHQILLQQSSWPTLWATSVLLPLAVPAANSHGPSLTIMAGLRDRDESIIGNFKRHSSLRRFDLFRPHAQSIASVSRTSSSSSSTLTRPSVFRKPTLRKMPKANSLSIHLPPTERSGSAGSGLHSGLTSPTPRTPLSPHSPQSPVRNNEMLGIQQAQYAEGYDVHVRSPINALPPPPSPKSPKHKTSKIFSNYKASKSTSKVNKVESPRLGTSSNSDAASSQVYLNRSAGKSSPDISGSYSDHPSPQSGECHQKSSACDKQTNMTQSISQSLAKTGKTVSRPKRRTRERRNTSLDTSLEERHP